MSHRDTSAATFFIKVRDRLSSTRECIKKKHKYRECQDSHTIMQREILNNDDGLSHVESPHACRRPSRVRWREEEGRVRKVNGV